MIEKFNLFEKKSEEKAVTDDLYFVDGNTKIKVSELIEDNDSFEDINYILLLDCNDELRNGDILRKFAEDSINIPSTAFLITQEWFSGALDSYYNTRFIKSRQGWRYIGVVHEYMATNIEENKKDKDGKDIECVIPFSSDIKFNLFIRNMNPE